METYQSLSREGCEAAKQGSPASSSLSSNGENEGIRRDRRFQNRLRVRGSVLGWGPKEGATVILEGQVLQRFRRLIFYYRVIKGRRNSVIWSWVRRSTAGVFRVRGSAFLVTTAARGSSSRWSSTPMRILRRDASTTLGVGAKDEGRVSLSSSLCYGFSIPAPASDPIGLVNCWGFTASERAMDRPSNRLDSRPIFIVRGFSISTSIRGVSFGLGALDLSRARSVWGRFLVH